MWKQSGILLFIQDPSSFEVSTMMVCADQLLWIKAATSVRNIYPQEHKADINGREEGSSTVTLKQFHTHYYWLYGKGMTHTMVGLQSLHLGDALKCPSISAGTGFKSFYPWCLKLGGNMEMFTVHLSWSALPDGGCIWHLFGICQHDCTYIVFETIGQRAKGSMTKSMWSTMPVKCTGMAQKLHKTKKRNRSLTIWKKKKHPN